MRYRIFCEDEGKHISVESLLVREVCPNNGSHTVRSGSLVVVSTSCDDYETSDYIQLRHDLIAYLTANFGIMSAEELRQASSHFCAPVEVRDMFFTIEEQIELGKVFHTRSCKCREIREDAAVSELFNRLTYEETGDVVRDLGDYLWKYTTLGVEGTTEGDIEGVFDYLTSTSGTSFESNGLVERGFTPRGMTIEELAARLLNILSTGSAD